MTNSIPWIWVVGTLVLLVVICAATIYDAVHRAIAFTDDAVKHGYAVWDLSADQGWRWLTPDEVCGDAAPTEDELGGPNVALAPDSPLINTFQQEPGVGVSVELVRLTPDGELIISREFMRQITDGVNAVNAHEGD